MSYSFVDTVSGQGGSAGLPSEAMKYNGVYLENEIPGYRTLYVQGRELMGAEVRDKQITGLDGSVYYGKTYPPRTIVVGYQLIADDNAAFRDAYNKMNQILDAEQVQIIFADETDKYFVGTKIGNTDPDPGANAVIGEIEIYCADPLKYATTLKEFTASVNMDGKLAVTIENDGSVPACINYEITHTHENGYIGIVSDSGVMEFGQKEEQDTESYQQNETLLHMSNIFAASDTPSLKDPMKPNYGCQGTLTQKSWHGANFLGFGSRGTYVGNANGGLRTITIPNDSSGAKGAKNWYTYLHMLMWASLMGQTGEMNINWLTEDNKMIAGLNWFKTDKSGNTGYYEHWANGKRLKQYKFQCNHLHTQNPWYWDWGHADVMKQGSKLRFYWWGNYPTYTVPEVENMICTKIQVHIMQWENRTGNQMINQLGLDKFDFTKYNVTKWRDVPNRYPAGCTCTIDGEYSKFYVNGLPKQSDEVVGTQYFKAPPGESEVEFYFSTFMTSDPTIKVTIREAWL